MTVHPDQGATTAVVVGSGNTALGALRSLRLAGVPTCVACPEGDLATHSRWYRPTPGPVAWDGALGPGVDDILRGMPLVDAVLIPGADDAAFWMAGFAHSELSKRFRVSTSSPQTLEILQNKARFAQFLDGTGIPHPRTFPIRCEADIAAIPFDEFDRVFIKPTDSQKFSRLLGVKALWATRRSEFERIWQKLQECDLDVVAQEYVPGDVADHYFIDGFRDRNGALPGLFARRRVRIFPPDFGNSSYCRSIPLTDVSAALESLSQLLSKLQYRGIFSAEFKRDAQDGQFRILEVNSRAWWYVEFAARCGVNVCRMACEDACEAPVTAASRSYPVGAGCVNLPGDIKTVLTQDQRARGSLVKVLGQWLRTHFLVFRHDDPMPGIVAFAMVASEYCRRKILHRTHASKPALHEPSSTRARE